MLRKKQTAISWDSRGNRMLTVSALCKEGCNWSREKWRESRKPLWLNRESDWSRYRNDEFWLQFLSTSAAGHKWWRLLADSDVPIKASNVDWNRLIIIISVFYMCPVQHVNFTHFIMMMLSNACKDKYKGTLLWPETTQGPHFYCIQLK